MLIPLILNVGDYETVYAALQPHFPKVRIITHDEQRWLEGCVLILPNTGGLNANISYCDKSMLFEPPQCNRLEYFRLNHLYWYVNKGTPIVGLGHSSWLIFGEVLKGKLFLKDGIIDGDAMTSSVVDWFPYGYKTKQTLGWRPIRYRNLHEAIKNFEENARITL